MGAYAFPKTARIRKRAEFIRLSKTGRRLHHRYFIANYADRMLPGSRLGVTVTRKVGNAAVRNRMKRLSRECFRRSRQMFTGNWDINIIVKKEAAALPSHRFFSALENLFKRLDGGRH